VEAASDVRIGDSPEKTDERESAILSQNGAETKERRARAMV
jgi:hypothetical protein